MTILRQLLCLKASLKDGWLVINAVTTYVVKWMAASSHVSPDTQPEVSAPMETKEMYKIDFENWLAENILNRPYSKQALWQIARPCHPEPRLQQTIDTEKCHEIQGRRRCVKRGDSVLNEFCLCRKHSIYREEYTYEEATLLHYEAATMIGSLNRFALRLNLLNQFRHCREGPV